ncbi:hypothetical protein N5B55_05130 [Ralstonia pickettii]|uniref:hypothetical protein n=1 Tax=Ralstonia pickettii TaxID=329 RepID=UPI002714F831|nr:hypothetical protein [Ralstonia pickettii]WKZ86338.1 hypothetical protein N5B55_05130 [Ralstonia pickettii]
MDAFLAGTPVEVVIPLQDRSGNQLDVTTVDYRVVDHAGVELVPRTPLDSFVAGTDEAVITVPAELNVLPVGQARAVRNVELFCTVGGNTVMVGMLFAIEAAETLMVGVNTYQTLAQAQLTSMDVPNIPAWESADERDKAQALVEARAHINQLSFTLLMSNINFGQDSLNYVPEGTFFSKYAATNGMFMFDGNLELLNPTQFAALPERFKAALRKAQVVEADAILARDPIAEGRRAGLVLESIGESKQMFRSAKPLELPVCKRALGYLSYFVTFGKRIGRGG